MGVKIIGSLAELNASFEEAGGKLVVVDFFATWCGPCKAIAPKLEKWSGEYTNVAFLKVDVDEADEIGQKYNISAMPTFFLFKNGEKVGELVGADADALEKLIKSNM